MSVFERFVEDSLSPMDGAVMQLSVMYQVYRQWCGRSSLYPETKRSFSKMLRDSGFTVKKKGKANVTVVLGFMPKHGVIHEAN